MSVSVGQGTAEEKARGVRFLVLDVDGVLTDGRVFLLPGGDELKSFDVKDGHRLAMAGRNGLKVVFMTGRSSASVLRRAEELGVHRVFQEARDKAAQMDDLLSEEGVGPEAMAYLGDDLVDLPAMRRCGLAAAVADAVPEVRAAADWVSAAPGGRGAVRELVEFVLKAQDRWDEAIRRYAS